MKWDDQVLYRINLLVETHQNSTWCKNLGGNGKSFFKNAETQAMNVSNRRSKICVSNVFVFFWRKIPTNQLWSKFFWPHSTTQHAGNGNKLGADTSQVGHHVLSHWTKFFPSPTFATLRVFSIAPNREKKPRTIFQYWRGKIDDDCAIDKCTNRL